MKCGLGGALAALLLALLAACSGPGAMIPPTEPQAGRLPPRLDPDGVLLLYAHGSRQEFRYDRCQPRGATTPRWLGRFAGTRVAGLPVSVYALCTPSRIGGFRHTERSGRPKVEQRAADLEDAVQRFSARGFDPGRIFLLGHSAGGWAALWAVRDGTPAVGGVVAFAPAFAGPTRHRSAGWQWLRDTHVRALRASERLPALVFAYRGDRFEAPAALAFLREIPGVTLTVLAPGDCQISRAHRAVFSDCVMDAQQRRRITAFIEQRVRATATGALR